MSFLKGVLTSALVRAFALNEVRHFATFAAGAIATWLLAHGAQQSDVANITEGLTALAVGLAGYAFSQWADAKRPSAAVELPSGKVIVLGKASNVTPEEEPAETAALNRSQLNK